MNTRSVSPASALSANTPFARNVAPEIAESALLSPLSEAYLESVTSMGVVYCNEAQVVAVQQILTVRDILMVRSFVHFAVV